MRRVLVVLTAATLSFGAAGAAEGQFALEARVGGAIPMGDEFGDAASTGYGLEAGAYFSVLPLVQIYGGLNWTRFGFEELDGEVDDAHFTDSGVFAGARVEIPAGPIRPWARGGFRYDTLKGSGQMEGLSMSIESDRTFGYEIGGGIGFSVLPMVSITPGVRYRSYSPEFGFAGETGETDVSYLSIDVGARVGL